MNIHPDFLHSLALVSTFDSTRLE